MLASRFLRFIISGGLNTAITYGIYLVLLQFIPYQVSYTVAYLTGIAISYTLNRSFVFRSHLGWRSALLFPMIYVIQYTLGMLLLWLWIDAAGLDDKVAPIVVIAVTLPLTYVLSRFVFIGNVSNK